MSVDLIVTVSADVQQHFLTCWRSHEGLLGDGIGLTPSWSDCFSSMLRPSILFIRFLKQRKKIFPIEITFVYLCECKSVSIWKNIKWRVSLLFLWEHYVGAHRGRWFKV